MVFSISLVHDSRSSDHDVYGVEENDVPGSEDDEDARVTNSKGVQTLERGCGARAERDDPGVLANFGGFTSATKSGINITTKKGAKHKFKSMNLVSRVHEKNLSARTFRSPSSPTSLTSFRSPPQNMKAKSRVAQSGIGGFNSSSNTPKNRMIWRARAKDVVYQTEEKKQFLNILTSTARGEMPYFNDLYKKRTGFNVINDKCRMSPFFNRIAANCRSGALSVKTLGRTESQKFRDRIKSSVSSTASTSPAKDPEVIDLCDDKESEKSKSLFKTPQDTPLARPRPSRDDDDIQAELDRCAPRPRAGEGDVTSPPGGSGVKSFNSLEAELRKKAVYDDDFVKDLNAKYGRRNRERDLQVQREQARRDFFGKKREESESSSADRMMKYLAITEVPLEVSDSEDEEEQETIEELPEITDEMEQVIQRANNSRGETLVDKFSITITRRDIDTLKGLNWLNDEVVNFYMQLICDRSEKTDNWPKVYAFNTFFYPRLMDKGHSALKRWTRKMDLFSFDLILIPVHLGMHWCLAVIDLSHKAVHYYDSMLGNNDRCLKALLQYLKDEHMDKKKSEFDVSGFEAKCIKDIPQQMNGSDCGMFACKFAEYLSRRAKITFDQEDMPYFRRRMVYEIVSAKLMHP